MAIYRTVTATASITNTAVSAAASVCDMAFAANAVSQRVVMWDKVYSGPYEVIPEVVSQTLETKDKLMRNDVTVREIPYYEVSNESGLTVYIAESLDD